ncbi:hypothetical protein T492DRAFT_848289 [Pavlovales sp. CCMP2436]|nr:hypothetical protein T492DRAFT_848289 [Pavlovales sp. CCMP2436]
MQLFFSAHEFTDPPGIDSDPALSRSASRPNVNLDVSDFTPAKIQLLYNALRTNFGQLLLKWIVSGNNQPNFGAFCDDKSTIYIFYLCKSRGGMGANGAPKVVPDWLTRIGVMLVERDYGIGVNEGFSLPPACPSRHYHQRRVPGFGRIRSDCGFARARRIGCRLDYMYARLLLNPNQLTTKSQSIGI